jgi:hypothetical protein
MRSCIVSDAALCGVGPGRSVVGSRPREVDVAAFVKYALKEILIARMRKSELLRALQTEIQKHNLDTFMSEKYKIVQTGCSTCQKHFGTVGQFKRHITEDVLPPLLDKLSGEGK